MALREVVLIIGKCVLILVILLYFSLYYLDAAVYIISCTLYFNIIASIFWMPSSSLASWYSGTSSTLHLVPLSFKRSSENPDVILMCFSICVTCDFFSSFSFQYFLFCIFNVLSILWHRSLFSHPVYLIFCVFLVYVLVSSYP